MIFRRQKRILGYFRNFRRHGNPDIYIYIYICMYIYIYNIYNIYI